MLPDHDIFIRTLIKALSLYHHMLL